MLWIGLDAEVWTMTMSGLRGVVARFDFSFAAAIMVAVLLHAPAAVAAHYSEIVLDAKTGEVLSQYRADAQNYPASLTKMMTLYLAFEALEQGRLRLDQRVSVSANAAAQPATRIGLNEGDTILVHDLILAMVTQSANDAAVVMAETLAGSEAAFADRMTRKARALGMNSTAFRNASGLPPTKHNAPNVTTARDMAKLARALYRNFPQEYGYFATEEFTYNGVTFANHNHLMSYFEGMDGIKTGFIRASGFNLAASAVRGDRRLIGVILGGESRIARDRKMAALLNTAFARDGTALAANDAAADTDDSDAALAKQAERTLAAMAPIAAAEAAPVEERHRAAHHGKKAAGKGWAIQVGAYAKEEAAEHAGAAALAKLPNAKGKRVVVLPPSDDTKVYRVRIAQFSPREAEKACRALHRKHWDCAVIGPAPTHVAGRHGHSRHG
jgi:D-alanyl-D-alanine carboxypeptidase